MKTDDYAKVSERTRQYYEQHADEYRNKTLKFRKMDSYVERFLKHVPQGGTVLDAGCGPGFETVDFLKRGYNVVAVDVCQSMIDMTRAAAKEAGFEEGPRLELRRMSLSLWENDLGLRWHADDRHFDGIWASASVVHLDWLGLGGILFAFYRCLNPGMPLFVSFKSKNEEILKAAEEGKAVRELVDTNSEGRTFFYHNPRNVACKLNLVGMKIVDWWPERLKGAEWEWEAIISLKGQWDCKPAEAAVPEPTPPAC
jgi:SAM-dependent methyltransferase